MSFYFFFSILNACKYCDVRFVSNVCDDVEVDENHLFSLVCINHDGEVVVSWGDPLCCDTLQTINDLQIWSQILLSQVRLCSLITTPMRPAPWCPVTTGVWPELINVVLCWSLLSTISSGVDFVEWLEVLEWCQDPPPAHYQLSWDLAPEIITMWKRFYFNC